MSRDMTDAQFVDACRRNGFRPGVFGLSVGAIGHTTTYGYVLVRRRGQWRIHRRQSLAKAIAKRQKDERAA